ncbi:MAG: helix-turn-helix transcriptional regulator [Lentisphaerae bacterium]|nr:helix-turn-helix transcriptional regulator [Lentisphaerota bacterium]
MTPILKAMGYFTSPRGGAPAPYRIPPNELVFELIAAGSVFAPNGNQLCGPGWLFVHRSGEHTIWRSPPGEHYECMVCAFTTADSKDEWPRAFPWHESEGAVSFAHEMLYAFHHTRVDTTILGDLVWSQFRFRLDQYRRHEQHTMSPRLAAVMAYMDRHLAEPLSIATLATRVALSPSHLHARFREATGMTPHQYLIRQRMRAARHLLATTSAPIKSIAVDVGYANPENFCRAFKQHAHTTAAAYRRRYMITR